MRKLAALLACTLVLAACSTDEAADSNGDTPSSSAAGTETTTDSQTDVSSDESSEGAAESATDGEIEVDKGLLNVEILLPADFVSFFSGGGSPESALTEISEEGFDDAVVNSDGSILLTMSRLRYERLMDEQRSSLEQYLEELPGPESGITKAEANRDFTEFTITVDRANASQETLGALGFLSFGLALVTGIYQIFDGTSPDETQLRVEYVDAATGEVFDVYDSATE